MKKYHVRASLFAHSCEFEVEADSLGEAMKTADEQFRSIYKTANGISHEGPLMSWSDRKIHVKEQKS